MAIWSMHDGCDWCWLWVLCFIYERECNLNWQDKVRLEIEQNFREYKSCLHGSEYLYCVDSSRLCTDFAQIMEIDISAITYMGLNIAYYNATTVSFRTKPISHNALP